MKITYCLLWFWCEGIHRSRIILIVLWTLECFPYSWAKKLHHFDHIPSSRIKEKRSRGGGCLLSLRICSGNFTHHLSFYVLGPKLVLCHTVIWRRLRTVELTTLFLGVMCRVQVGGSNAERDGNLGFRKQVGVYISHISKPFLKQINANYFKCLCPSSQDSTSRKEHIIA